MKNFISFCHQQFEVIFWPFAYVNYDLFFTLIIVFTIYHVFWPRLFVLSCESDIKLLFAVENHPIHEFPLSYANPTSPRFEMKLSIISSYRAAVCIFIFINICICTFVLILFVFHLVFVFWKESEHDFLVARGFNATPLSFSKLPIVPGRIFPSHW